MSDPYQVLGLSREAGERQIRKQYLRLVRERSPERDPEGFARVQEAYEQLRDPVRRLERELLEWEHAQSLEDLASDLRRRLARHRLATDLLLDLGESR